MYVVLSVHLHGYEATLLFQENYQYLTSDLHLLYHDREPLLNMLHVTMMVCLHLVYPQ